MKKTEAELKCNGYPSHEEEYRVTELKVVINKEIGGSRFAVEITEGYDTYTIKADTEVSLVFQLAAFFAENLK